MNANYHIRTLLVVFNPIVLAGIMVLLQQPLFAQFTANSLISPNAEYFGHFGWSVSGAGDVNNDGYIDVLAGAWAEDATLTTDGRAYIFSGKTDSLLYTLVSPNPAHNGFFGFSVSASGDVNNDGYADVLIGAWKEKNLNNVSGAGQAHIFSGADGSLLYTLGSPYAEMNGNFGYSVSGAGDVNNDGYADVVASAINEDAGGHNGGRAYVFSGADGSLLHTLNSPTPEYNGWFGNSVSHAGDVNSDSHSDVIIGAQFEDGGAYGAGRAYIFSGADGSILYTLTSPNAETNGYFGISVSGGGDQNADGYSEVIVGASSEFGGADNSGRAYLFSGVDGSLLYSLSSPNAEVDGSFGSSVSGAGDVDKDGIDDVVVGAVRESGGADKSGRAYIFGGADGVPLYTLNSPDADSNGQFGLSVSGMGDLNDDEYADVLIGACFENGGILDGGQAHVFVSDRVVAIGEPLKQPNQYQLEQNYPNPFNPNTTLRFSITDFGFTELKVLDLVGRGVKNLVSESLSPGNYDVQWDGTNKTGQPVASGIYLYQLKVQEFVKTRKMILLR